MTLTLVIIDRQRKERDDATARHREELQAAERVFKDKLADGNFRYIFLTSPSIQLI
jgi:hypothetical protein